LVRSVPFTTPVPHPVDLGHDFDCVPERPTANRRTLRAGAGVQQVRRTLGPGQYDAGDATAWLSDQERPLFLCIVDRPTLTCVI
jgi:hypothetical protein